jgi:hypothetical protein
VLGLRVGLGYTHLRGKVLHHLEQQVTLDAAQCRGALHAQPAQLRVRALVLPLEMSGFDSKATNQEATKTYHKILEFKQ